MKFIGKIKKYSSKKIYDKIINDKIIEEKILLEDLEIDSGEIVNDHVWMPVCGTLADAKLVVGDVISFCAKVVQYEKGFRGENDKDWEIRLEHPIEIDYSVADPSNIEIISEGWRYVSDFIEGTCMICGCSNLENGKRTCLTCSELSSEESWQRFLRKR